MGLEKKSVKERKFNIKLYEKIFKITKKPKKILDVGCGLNPLYFPYKSLLGTQVDKSTGPKRKLWEASGKDGIYYIATDIDKNILKKVKKHFRKNKIKGEVFYLDIKDLDGIKKINEVDVVFIFKVFDIFKKNKKLAMEVIRNLKTNFIVVSFAIKTTYGKIMKKPKRKWFENILKKLNYSFKVLKFYNEVFYIIKK